MKNYLSLFVFAFLLIAGVVLGNQFFLAIAGLALLSMAYKRYERTQYVATAVYAVLGLSAVMTAILPEFAGVIGTGGFMIAITPVIGEQSVLSATDPTGAGDKTGARDDLFIRDVEDTVFMIGVDDFPLTTMQKALKTSKPLKSTKAEWYEDEYYDREDLVATAQTAQAQGDGTLAEGLNSFVVDNPNKFVIGNIIGIPAKLAESSTNPLGELKLYIKDINYSSGLLTVKQLNNGANALPALADGDKLYRHSIAGTEMQAQVKPKHTEAVQYQNFIQRFIGQVETSDLRALISTYTGDDATRQQKKQVYDFRESIEYANLFGVPDEIIDNEGNLTYLQGGIEHYAKGYIEYTQGGLTQQTFNAWCKQIFSRNNGSRQRLLLVDEDLMLDILNVPSVDKTLSATSTEIVLGVEVNRINTSYGKLLLKVHKGFQSVGRFHYGMAIDMPNISDRILKPFSATELELKKSGQRNVVKAIFMEQWKSLRVANGATHTIIKGVLA